MPQKPPKLPSKTSQSHQNEVPRATQSRQNIESSEKVKSNENISNFVIYNTFEGLGHQNSPEFAFNNQENMQLLKFPMIAILQIFQIHLVCKSTVNWLPEGPAAGAKP